MCRNSLPEPFKSYNYKVPVTVGQRDVLRKALSPQTRKIVDSMISHAKYGEICQLLTEYKRSTIIFFPSTTLPFCEDMAYGKKARRSKHLTLSMPRVVVTSLSPEELADEPSALAPSGAFFCHQKTTPYFKGGFSDI